MEIMKLRKQIDTLERRNMDVHNSNSDEYEPVRYIPIGDMVLCEMSENNAIIPKLNRRC